MAQRSIMAQNNPDIITFDEARRLAQIGTTDGMDMAKHSRKQMFFHQSQSSDTTILGTTDGH
jgi:hypothetical protein